LGRVNLL